jgi:hypothetical protein
MVPSNALVLFVLALHSTGHPPFGGTQSIKVPQSVFWRLTTNNNNKMSPFSSTLSLFLQMNDSVGKLGG